MDSARPDEERWPMNREDGPLVIAALTRQGVELALRLHAGLPGSVLAVPARHQFAVDMGAEPFHRLASVFEVHWPHARGFVCVMAAGIVVRHVAPYLLHKASDPAVVVMDERGQFAISLVSGHLGGANCLAREVAALTGGEAVITTASDVQEKPALDLLACQLGLEIENLPLLSRVTRAILEGERVWLYDPEGVLRPFLEGYVLIHASPATRHPSPLPGIWVSEREPPLGTPPCLLLRPRNLVVGVGCNRGTPAGEILSFIEEVFAAHRLSLLAIRNLATIDAKNDEEGLLEAARALKRPIRFFSREEIARVSVPTPSAMVAKHMGVHSVCEATALLSAQHGTLLIPKQKTPNVTLAVCWAGSPS